MTVSDAKHSNLHLFSYAHYGGLEYVQWPIVSLQSRFATCTALPLHLKRDDLFFSKTTKRRLLFRETTLQRRQYAPKINRLQNLDFKLVLWTNSSRNLLARGHFLLVWVNDFVRGWIDLTLTNRAGQLKKLYTQQEILLVTSTGRDLFGSLYVSLKLPTYPSP